MKVKDGMIVTGLFVLLLLSVALEDGGRKFRRHTTAREWTLSNISLPIGIRPIPRSGDEVLIKTPPSQKQIALKIARLPKIQSFTMNGWLVTFMITRINLRSDKTEIVFRAIAEQTGSARYSYRVSESEGDSADSVVITVDPPVPASICADSTESNGGYCRDGSIPK